jgi:hypothetical protein
VKGVGRKGEKGKKNGRARQARQPNATSNEEGGEQRELCLEQPINRVLKIGKDQSTTKNKNKN